MKKKIMAFLLAAAMVVGSATSASAFNANIKILGVKGAGTEKTNATFDAQNNWDFKGDTNINTYTAPWSSQKDDTSVAIIEAWKNGKVVYESTKASAFWETNGVYNYDSKIRLDDGVYGSVATNVWDDTKDFATNATGTTATSYNNYILAKDNGVFAFSSASGTKSAAGVYEDAVFYFRSGCGVILQDTVDTWSALQQSNNRDDNKKADDMLTNWVGKIVTTGSVAASAINDADKVVAFVDFNQYATVRDTLDYNGVTLGDWGNNMGANKLVGNYCDNLTGKQMISMVTIANSVLGFNTIAPFEALQTNNSGIARTAYGMYSMYNAQQYDLYEVIVNDWTPLTNDTYSLDDRNFAVPDDLKSTVDKQNKSFVWRWNNINSRDAWVNNNALYKETDKKVEQAWKDAISAKLVEAYNAAIGEDKLNADAIVGDVKYYDIKQTTGDKTHTQTLIYGGDAKGLIDGMKAVKVLHWTGKAWEQVGATAIRLPDNGGNDSYGILMDTNTYSPFLIIGIANEGTGADATADAAKNPEKSGKTGVSFLGL